MYTMVRWLLILGSEVLGLGDHLLGSDVLGLGRHLLGSDVLEFTIDIEFGIRGDRSQC